VSRTHCHLHSGLTMTCQFTFDDHSTKSKPFEISFTQF